MNKKQNKSSVRKKKTDATGFLSKMLVVRMISAIATSLVKRFGKFMGSIIFFFINMIAILVIGVLLAWATLSWLDDYTNHNEAHLVPNVCGMTLETAAETLEKQSFAHAVLEYRHKPGAKEGEVLEQRPRANAKVKEGRRVYLVLNTSEPPKLGVPPVVDNCSMREAEFRLKAVGFVIEGIETVPGEREWVYGLRYKGNDLDNGAAIPRGSKVTLVVGNGQQESQDTVRIDQDFF